MSAADLMIWGLVLHLVGDWLLQNEWMASNKALRRPRAPRHGNGLTTPPRVYTPPTRWWDRHPAGYVHAAVHGLLMLLVFPWWGALAIAVTHWLIDLRAPVAWWSRLIGQTQPSGQRALLARAFVGAKIEQAKMDDRGQIITKLRPKSATVEGAITPLYDIGTEVRIWTDQVAHIVVVAVVALLAGSG